MNSTEEKFAVLQQLIEGELGDMARTAFFAPQSVSTQKADGSVITEVDTAIEQNLKQFISEHFPADSMYGEEEGYVPGSSGYVWIIDPIDGTDNFARKIPFFAITVTRQHLETQEGTFSVIYNPVSRQLFKAYAGSPVYENEHQAEPLATTIGGRNFITVTGANKSAPWIKPARQNIQKALSLEFGKSGHYHSSLLEHVYVATGKLDGLLQLEMNAWDSAAGAYLVQAGGGMISVYRDGRWQRHEGSVLSLYGVDLSLKPTLFVSVSNLHERTLSLIKNPAAWAGEF